MQNLTLKPTAKESSTTVRKVCNTCVQDVTTTLAQSHSASQTHATAPSPTNSAITITPPAPAKTHSTDAPYTRCNTPDLWEAMSAIQDDDDDEDMDEYSPSHNNTTLEHSQCGLVLWCTMDALMDSFEYGARR